MPIPTDYKTVPERIADFKEAHPSGCLRAADLDHPYRIETIGSDTFVVYVAAAYRTPDDPCPGIGSAWERFPGPTNFTRDSELQNAETSAWGRAIVAVLASESKHIASREDVTREPAPAIVYATDDQHAAITDGISHLSEDGASWLAEWWKERALPSLKRGEKLSATQADMVLRLLPTIEDKVTVEDAPAEGS